jgi:hypothetical protein
MEVNNIPLRDIKVDPLAEANSEEARPYLDNLKKAISGDAAGVEARTPDLARTGYAELQRCPPLAWLVHGECPIPRLPAQHSVPRCESLSLWRLGQSHGQSETSESTQWSQCPGRRMSDSRHRFGIRTGTGRAPKSWGLACCSFSILSPKRPTKYKRCHDQQFDCDYSDH